jgi:hypothetical protein
MTMTRAPHSFPASAIATPNRCLSNIFTRSLGHQPQMLARAGASAAVIKHIHRAIFGALTSVQVKVHCCAVVSLTLSRKSRGADSRLLD